MATFDQYKFVQDRWFVVHQDNVHELQDAHPDEAGVRAAAERFREKTELLAWLPMKVDGATSVFKNHLVPIGDHSGTPKWDGFHLRAQLGGLYAENRDETE